MHNAKKIKNLLNSKVLHVLFPNMYIGMYSSLLRSLFINTNVDNVCHGRVPLPVNVFSIPVKTGKMLFVEGNIQY